MKKLKGEGNFPSYFDNGDVVLHIFAKFQIWNWLRRNIVVRKNKLFLYCYTKLSLSRRTGNQYLSSWNNLLNNFLFGLMFQYSFLLKSITCINYLIAYETSSEKIQNHSTHTSLRMVYSRPKRHKVRRVDFSAIIDYVIFIIRGFPLYTYSMAVSLCVGVRVCVCVCLFVYFLSPPKRLTFMSWKEWFFLKCRWL